MNTMVQALCAICGTTHTKTLKQVNQAIKKKGRWACFNCMAGHNKLKLEGAIFGRLTVLSQSESVDTGSGLRAFWNCLCKCGKTLVVSGNLLKQGRKKSCGCLSLESLSNRATTHGKSHTREFRIWSAMRSRCRNKNVNGYENYGGRGIKVCERWESFDNFILDMGESPSGFSIERKDTNGNYEPLNCIWADRTTQARNKRSNRIIEFNGVSKCLIEWANDLGIDQSSLRERLNLWTLEESLTTPKGKHK